MDSAAMTIELTDEDRAAIRAAKEKAIRDESSKTEAVYLLGVRAGMERAAKLCDGYVTGRDDTTVAMLCADAIREAAR